MFFFFFQAEDGIRDLTVTGVQTCALPISTTAWAKASRLLKTRGASASDPAWTFSPSPVGSAFPERWLQKLIDPYPCVLWPQHRSEERRVGKECRSRGSLYH